MLLIRIAFLWSLFLVSVGCSLHQDLNFSSASSATQKACPAFAEGPPTIALSGQGTLRFPESTYLYREIVKADWKLVEIEIAPVTGVKEGRVVFYFGGGPRATPAKIDVVNLLKRTYLDGHTKVVILAHTGNELPNLNGNARLKTYGMRSVLCDAKVASEYIRHAVNEEHTSIVIHGNSYGSVLALAVAAELNELKNVKVVLQAPWFFPLSTKAIISNNSAFFTMSDDGINLGNRSTYQSDLEHLYKNLLGISADVDGSGEGEQIIAEILEVGCESMRAPVFAMIGSLEDRSYIQSTYNYFECFGEGAEVAVSVGAPHGSELAVETTREKLQDFLSRN